MAKLEFVLVLAYFTLIVFSALGLGIGILKLLKRLMPDDQKTDFYHATWLGIALMTGLGSLGYIWLSTGILEQFTRPMLLTLTIGILGLSAKNLLPIAVRTKKWIVSAVSLTRYPLAVVAMGFVVLIIGTLYFAAMEPPHATDELHYHFPEARLIAGTHKVPFVLGGHYFYGNIPKLMEVIFAAGISISGYGLAHTLNLAFFLGFLLFLAGFLTKRYSFVTASFALLLIVLFDDITWNATVGFVDAATVSLEITALLLTIEWFVRKNRFTLAVSGIMIGLALSIKYAPIATLIFMLAIIAIGTFSNAQLRKTWFKHLAPFSITALIFGGYWYFKNLALHHNPFYPLYLGHKGVDNESYQSLIAAIQEFGSRSFKNFLAIPQKYPSFNHLITYFSFYLWPLALLVTKSRKIHALLALYFALYVPYWFFFATHQTRFLMPAVIVGFILSAIFLTQISRRWLVVSLLVIVGLAIRLNNKEHFYTESSLSYFMNSKLRTSEIQYALGHVSQTQFLNDEFGCQYGVVETMQRNGWTGNSIDNWSIWHAPSVAFFASPQNRFQIYGVDVKQDRGSLIQDLQSNGLRYIYYDEQVKKRHLANPDPEVMRFRPLKESTETFLLPFSNLIYETGQCKLYEIDFDRLAKNDQ